MDLPAGRAIKRAKRYAFRHWWRSPRFTRWLRPSCAACKASAAKEIFKTASAVEGIVPSQKKTDRRYQNIRSRMREADLDALIVCGNQYAGFEGAVFYTSGFEIVHRYVYVLIPLAGNATLVFPRAARWIGDKKKPWVQDQVWPDIPGKWLRERIAERRWKRIGTYGMNFVMAVRDYRELAEGPFAMVPFDQQFDMARAVKSEEELVE